jgi:hypothetical protein
MVTGLAAAAMLAPFAFSSPARATEVSMMQNYGPGNDDFARAANITADLYLIPGDLAYASREMQEPRINSASIGRTVWYRYVATETGRAVAFLTKRYYGAPFQIAVYSGTKLTDLKRLGIAQVAGSDTEYSGAVGFDAVKGTAYFIQVDRAPMSSTSVTSFLLGVAPVGTTGRIAAFASQPLIFQERDFDSYRKVFVANGHTGTTTMTYALSNLNTNISVSTTKTTLKANETTVFNFSDANSNFDSGTVHSGKLDLISKSATSTILGSRSVPLRVITSEYTNKPNIEVRFVDPKPGAPVSGVVQSLVYVRNTSTSTALGCRFDTHQYDYNSLVSLKVSEVLTNGWGSPNPIFDIAPNTIRKFSVSGRIAANDYYSYVKLMCSNSYGTFSNNESSYLEPTAYYGIYPSLKINPTTNTVFGEVNVPDFGTKRVFVTLTNSGNYSGYFSIRAYDDTYQDKAVITAMCLVNDAGSCIGPSSTDTVEFDMARGETRRIAVSVRRGNSDPGEVELWAHAIDYNGYDVVGYGAFTVRK